MSAGVLPFLRAIDFTKNNFKDDFPAAVANMTSLTWLRANKTHLSDVPDSLCKLNKLEDLILSRNEIKELPQEITEMAGLRSLNLRHNKLQKEGIPYSLFDLEELTTLDFSHNNLDSCPENLHRAKALLVLNVAHNRIKEVPPSLFTQLKYMQHLDLSNNLIEYIPPQIRRLQQLKSLNISYNPLQHDQFRSLSGLTQLESLNIAHTQRGINNIPSEFDKLASLTEIDLSYNKLTRVPEPVYRLENLKRANFSHNEISEMSSLTECWTELITLNLTENKLKDIPACICKLTKLKRLYLNGNQITFEGVPSLIGKLQNLEVFMAARNLLTCIPDSLCKCNSLKQMNLSGNQLVALPASIWELKQLKNLNTDDNPSLVMPDKPPPEVKGSGAEFYNVDFSLYNQRKVAGLKPSAETMPQKDKEAERKKLRARLRIKQAQLKGEEEGSSKDSSKFLKGMSEYKEDSGSVSTYLSSRARLNKNENEDEERKLIKHKKWTDALTKPALDYSELFPEVVNGSVGQEEGLYMWRIDNFLPLLLDDAVGRFYETDCYIILHANQRDNLPGLQYNIHFWIGAKCEIDKKACAAIHAVHLRNMLGCDNRTTREEQGDESDEFILYFDGDIEVLEGGSESGFFQVEETIYVKRLYKCHGQNNVLLEPVEIHVDSIDHRHSYLLDDGMDIVVWFGKLSKLTQQKKATLFAEKINKLERKNKAKITVITKYESEKQQLFFSMLEGDASVISEPAGEKVEDYDDAYSVPTPKLYEVHLGVGYLELPQLEFSVNRPMTQQMLRTQRVYLLDSFTDVFVWVGAHSDRLLRAAAAKLSIEILKMIKRPATAIVNTCFEGVESAMFRSFFHKWDDIVAVDFTRAADKVIAAANTDGKGEMKVDLTALFIKREPPMSQTDCTDYREQWKENLETMSCFVMEGKNYTRLPAGEQGHFYTENCYIFLCTYWMFISDFNDDLLEQYVILQKKTSSGKKKTTEEGENGGEEGGSEEEEEEEEEALVCRVYFWQGRDASKVCWPQYSLSSFRSKIREKIGIKMPVEDERCYQQQENMKFLSYFNGQFMIHKGKRPANNDPESPHPRPRLYQVRQNGNILAQRCVEIGCSSLLLNSGFCYMLKVPAEKDGEMCFILYVWIGSRSSEELMNASIEIGKEAFDDVDTVSVLYEGTNEPDIFWSALGGRRQYDTNADWMALIRLFRCSNERGYFAVSEKCSDFCQDDLSDEDVMILDSGTDVFVWIGEESSDVERKLALKSAQLYQQHIQDLSGEARKLSIVRRGKENLKFIKLFHGWGPFRARTKTSS
ncbi:protein flightless-1 homolog isoform X2 [Bolinopsis microptera]|uniref:protein flightless-1 homolog isoform X2 n=1 Tax=Bolinopsis microptera TaxID=2820187 RepID=UPI003078DD95